VELDAACRAARELLDRLVGEHIHLWMTTKAPGLAVLAEPGEIEQILMNLVANSRDAMPEGGDLRVETEPAADSSSVTLSVSDNGKGMDERTRLRLFEPFFTTKGPGEGTGLGLSTVFAVTRQRGGEIRVDSQEGRGTTVKVRLPVVARNLTTRIANGPTPRGSETVLAVEDDPVVRETIEGDLRALGYTPVMAAHPEEALAAAARAPSGALLLTDVMMPGKLGGDLAREIQRRRPGLRALFMSAHPQSELLRLNRIAPGDRLLSKPFGQHELGVAVRAVLDAAPANPRDTPPGARTEEPAGDRRALIIDDDPDVAETMGEALEHVGLAATIAHTGAEAIRIAGDLRPVLVFCDVTLGKGLSGYDVARALRADPRLQDATLIAVTGLPADQCAAAATAAGFDDVLTKPVDLDRLEKLARLPRSAHPVR
jgi:CheY-like chemotaxis protein